MTDEMKKVRDELARKYSFNYLDDQRRALICKGFNACHEKMLEREEVLVEAIHLVMNQERHSTVAKKNEILETALKKLGVGSE